MALRVLKISHSYRFVKNNLFQPNNLNARPRGSDAFPLACTDTALSRWQPPTRSPSVLLAPRVCKGMVRDGAQQHPSVGRTGLEPGAALRPRQGKRPHVSPWAARQVRKGQEGSRTARSLLGTPCKMATPSLRSRLARFANPGKPVLKPNKPLILANSVGNRRREKGGEHWERGWLGRRAGEI